MQIRFIGVFVSDFVENATDLSKSIGNFIVPDAQAAVQQPETSANKNDSDGDIIFEKKGNCLNFKTIDVCLVVGKNPKTAKPKSTLVKKSKKKKPALEKKQRTVDSWFKSDAKKYVPLQLSNSVNDGVITIGQF